jgi:hypothetical protein
MWKDFNELEENISMPELTAILTAKREQDYNEKKFMAALQGVDLDKTSGVRNSDLERVINNAKKRISDSAPEGAPDPNDITALKGRAAASAGFGIGMGLDYEVM